MKLLILLSALVAFSSAVTYTVNVKTAPLEYSDSNSIAAVLTLSGDDVGPSGSDANEAILSGLNEFANGAVDTFTIESDTDIGNLDCLTIDVGKSNAWLVDWISISSDSNPVARYVYNTESVWLSSDLTEGSDSLELCVQGEETYYVVVESTGSANGGSDDINLKVEMSGAKKTTKTGFLNNVGWNDFEAGSHDVFVINNLPDVGKVTCITLTAQGSDMWTFSFVTVHSTTYSNTPRYFYNSEEINMSADETEGVSELKICLNGHN